MPMGSLDGSLRTVFQSMPMRESLSETLEDKTLKHIELLTLSEIRKNLPKIAIFDGKPEKWLTFQRDVERNRSEGKYPEQLMKSQLRMALAGQALARVEGLFDTHTVDQIMYYLREALRKFKSFGGNSKDEINECKAVEALDACIVR